MELTRTTFDLQLKNSFGIAGNSRTTTRVVFVRLQDGTFSGLGEASVPPYLPETSESVIQFLGKLELDQYHADDEKELRAYLHSHAGNYAAKAAVEIALLDLLSKKKGLPAFRIFGDEFKTPQNTFTIGIGPLDEIPSKLKDASGFRIIKVKLGSVDDKAIINVIREVTQLPICVDVNQGWESKEVALNMIEWLSERNVILVEQPLSKKDLSGQRWLKERSPLPVYADESMQGMDDLDAIHECFHGINIKLMKCGGPWQAVRIAEKAKHLGLKILLGSMNESTCANIAAAHISSFADFTDLDGPYLISNNPFKDPVMQGGRIILSEQPGLGLELKEGILNFPERKE